MSEEQPFIYITSPLISEIKAELLRLCHQAKDMEEVGWYDAINDCFENGEFGWGNRGNLRWRVTVCNWKKYPIGRLNRIVTRFLQEVGIVDNENNWIAPAKEPTDVQ